MQLARVIGDVVVTVKDTNLSGIKLMVLQPLASDGSAAGRTLVAVDAVGAGVGETVFFVRGKEASFPFHPAEVPADAGIVGIVDHWDLDGNPGDATIGTKNLPETGDRRPETRHRRPKSGD